MDGVSLAFRAADLKCLLSKMCAVFHAVVARGIDLGVMTSPGPTELDKKSPVCCQS